MKLNFRYLSGVPHPAMLGGWEYGGMMFTPTIPSPRTTTGQCRGAS